MPQIPQGNPAAEKDTRKLLQRYFTSFNGVNTQSSRTAIPDDYFYNLENIIPIGPQNAHVVPNISASLVNYGSDFIYWSQGLNLNNVEYLVNFATNGKVFLYNIAAQTSALINSGTLLSGAGSQCTQWNDTAILFIDSTGYYYYDGTTFAIINGTGAPSSGNSIAVYGGRVWIAAGRVLYCSGVDGYQTAGATNYWTAANGAAFINLTDPTIRSNIQRLIAANGYLYIFTVTGINAISDVYVPSGANPPTPVFTNTNLQALIGSNQPASIIPYDRNIMFASPYGVHTLVGVDSPKISGDIDGTWQYRDPAQNVSAGQVVVENILCGAFLIKRLNDPVFGSNQIVCLWFSTDATNANSGVDVTTDVWWFANYGALTFIVTGLVSNVPSLFGFIGNQLYQLFGSTATYPTITAWTKLYPMEDEFALKEVIQVGVESDIYSYGTSFGLYVESQTQSILAPTATPPVSIGEWQNSAGVQGEWINSGNVMGSWISPGLTLAMGAPAGAMYSRHVGLRLQATGYNLELHTLGLDYKLGPRWSPLPNT
jgi:hypothetical protein